MSDLDGAWAELPASMTPGWYVGTPSDHVERRGCGLYAFDTRERAHIERRSRA
jgi:hypothetical protein